MKIRKTKYSPCTSLQTSFLKHELQSDSEYIIWFFFSLFKTWIFKSTFFLHSFFFLFVWNCSAYFMLFCVLWWIIYIKDEWLACIVTVVNVAWRVDVVRRCIFIDLLMQIYASLFHCISLWIVFNLDKQYMNFRRRFTYLQKIWNFVFLLSFYKYNFCHIYPHII